eukprot:PhF_6_TR11507/c0_g1_i1/m.18388
MKNRIFRCLTQRALTLNSQDHVIVSQTIAALASLSVDVPRTQLLSLFTSATSIVSTFNSKDLTELFLAARSLKLKDEKILCSLSNRCLEVIESLSFQSFVVVAECLSNANYNSHPVLPRIVQHIPKAIQDETITARHTSCLLMSLSKLNVGDPTSGQILLRHVVNHHKEADLTPSTLIGSLYSASRMRVVDANSFNIIFEYIAQNNQFEANQAHVVMAWRVALQSQEFGASNSSRAAFISLLIEHSFRHLNQFGSAQLEMILMVLSRVKSPSEKAKLLSAELLKAVNLRIQKPKGATVNEIASVLNSIRDPNYVNVDKTVVTFFDFVKKNINIDGNLGAVRDTLVSAWRLQYKDTELFSNLCDRIPTVIENATPQQVATCLHFLCKMEIKHRVALRTLAEAAKDQVPEFTLQNITWASVFIIANGKEPIAKELATMFVNRIQTISQSEQKPALQTQDIHMFVRLLVISNAKSLNPNFSSLRDLLKTSVLNASQDALKELPITAIVDVFHIFCFSPQSHHTLLCYIQPLILSQLQRMKERELAVVIDGCSRWGDAVEGTSLLKECLHVLPSQVRSDFKGWSLVLRSLIKARHPIPNNLTACLHKKILQYVENIPLQTLCSLLISCIQLKVFHRDVITALWNHMLSLSASSPSDVEGKNFLACVIAMATHERRYSCLNFFTRKFPTQECDKIVNKIAQDLTPRDCVLLVYSFTCLSRLDTYSYTRLYNQIVTNSSQSLAEMNSFDFSRLLFALAYGGCDHKELKQQVVKTLYTKMSGYLKDGETLFMCVDGLVQMILSSIENESSDSANTELCVCLLRKTVQLLHTTPWDDTISIHTLCRGFRAWRRLLSLQSLHAVADEDVYRQVDSRLCKSLAHKVHKCRRELIEEISTETCKHTKSNPSLEFLKSTIKQNQHQG